MSLIEKALAKQKLAHQQAAELKPKKTKETHKEPQMIPIGQTDDVLTNTEDVAQQIGDTDIVLDFKNLIERSFIVDDTKNRLHQEEYRGIKRKLLGNAFGPQAKTLDNSNLIMVSSSKPNEGKTFISINLALSIALEQDKTVLLIDSDLLRPSINRELGFEMKKGLTEYLLSEVNSLSDIIYSTNINNLKIIPAGRPHSLTNELLASDKMALLTKELGERYPDRIVVFDCPPILGVNETAVISKFMGQAVVVVEESKTKIADVKIATSLLNEELAVGLVINKSLKSTQDSYGYYGYGYGYGAKN
jgi:receptor protein-tyrosine kinase